jgi:hypothetical protein
MRFFKKRQPEKLFKKYFSFLIEQYGFTYTPWCYTSGKLKIILEMGHKSPGVTLAYLGEPKFTEFIFERIVDYFGGKVPEIYFPDHSIEHNIRFVAELFRDYAPKIVDHLDDWWIPFHKFEYERIKKDYEESDQLNDFLSSYKRHYDYLKSKGAI